MRPASRVWERAVGEGNAWPRAVSCEERRSLRDDDGTACGIGRAKRRQGRQLVLHTDKQACNEAGPASRYTEPRTREAGRPGTPNRWVPDRPTEASPLPSARYHDLAQTNNTTGARALSHTQLTGQRRPPRRPVGTSPGSCGMHLRHGWPRAGPAACKAFSPMFVHASLHSLGPDGSAGCGEPISKSRTLQIPYSMAHARKERSGEETTGVANIAFG